MSSRCRELIDESLKIDMLLKSIINAICSIFRQLIRPLSVIKYHGMSFFLWIMFTLIGGLLGVFVSVAKNTLFENPPLSLAQALYLESANGSFYTYSIAVVAAVLSSVFIIFSEKKELSFRRYQIPLITFSTFLLLFGGVFYALSKKDFVRIEDIPDTVIIKVEWKQLTIFILSILFSIYSFCVCHLDAHSDVYSDISDDRLKNKLSDTDSSGLQNKN